MEPQSRHYGLVAACGTGRLLAPYVHAGLEVDGCDASSDTVNPVLAGGSATGRHTGQRRPGDVRGDRG
jgi:SAM-dependent methyltransferase